MEINVGWADIKAFITTKSISIQYVVANNSYYLFAADGPMQMTAQIRMDGTESDNQTDFETNYKSTANSPLLPLLTTVTTQFELRNKTIKLANVSGTVQSDGTVTAYLQVPGTVNPTGDATLDGRWISSGTAFFDIATPGDVVNSVRFVDHDNILGQGVDFVVGSYTDDEAPSGSQGWFIPPAKGEIKAEAIGGYGFAPAGFYIMITAKKGGGLTTGTLYVNLEWGKLGS
jgi:hypothetical protein